MITILIVLAVYLVGIFAFCLWDSLIGMFIEWDGTVNPPLFIAAVLWPVMIPIVLIVGFINFLDKSKEKRLMKEKAQTKLRVALQKEQDAALEQVDLEIQGIIKKQL